MPGSRVPSYQTGHPVMGAIGPRRTAVFIGQAYPKSHILGAQVSPYIRLGTNILIDAYPMKTAVRLGAISPITG